MSLKTKTIVLGLLLLLLGLFATSAFAACSSSELTINYNNVNVTSQWQPFIQDDVCYAIDYEVVKAMTSIHQMSAYPIFSQINKKWVQTMNLFTNTDWQESISIVLIATQPNSNTVAILRSGKIENIALDKNVLAYPNSKVSGLVYYASQPVVVAGSDYPTHLFFNQKLKTGNYHWNAVPIRSFITSVLPGADIVYDKCTNAINITCEGSY